MSEANENNKNELVFVPLGGVGEIGMNLALYGYGPPQNREWIAIDCGVSFAGSEFPGVELVLPDISFLESERTNLLAIVITHAHEDHYGALLSLWPRLKVPVYATPFTAGMLDSKREGEPGAPKIPVQVFRAGDRFEIGPFALEAINVTHSIPEPVSLAIRTPFGTVLHTGDWKIDAHPALGAPTDEHRLRAIGEEGVLALVCDSTNAMREGVSPSESEVGASLTDIIRKSPGRVAVTTFSSNVGRVRDVALAAAAAGRQCMLMGRSMRRVVEVASELGYLDGVPPFVAESEFGYLPRDKAVILMTGSQGEPRAALARIARDDHPQIALSKGDLVIFSSRTIPGNERGIIDIQNLLIDRGIEILEDRDALVHVSGHPRRAELRQMYDWIKPSIAVPVHGEAAHLTAHATLAESLGVRNVCRIRNGRMLRLAPGAPEVVDEVPVGRFYKDGLILGNEEETGIAERRRLSYAGHVTVLVELAANNELRDDPDVVCVGLPRVDGQGEDFEELLIDAVGEAIESIPRQRRKDDDLVREAARRAARAATNRAWGKKPIITVFLTRG